MLKTDNQLKAIEDQGDRQLDLIDDINNDRRRSIGFKNERLAKLEKRLKIKKKKLEIIREAKKKKIEIRSFLIIQQQMAKNLILLKT